MSRPSYYRAVEDLAKRYGAEVKWHDGHGKIRHSDGWQVSLSGSPKNIDHALLNIERDIRRKKRGVFR